MKENEFKFRLKKDMKNNGGQELKKNDIVIVKNIYCHEPFNNPRCTIEKDNIIIHTSIRDLYNNL